MKPEIATNARIAILMATYNGTAFIGEQLDTIRQQTVGQIDIWASDDGSSDNTVKILKDYAASWDRGVINVVNGPSKGFSENFRSLIVNPQINADFYAFADQDDLWDADKLERAIDWLGDAGDSQPRLYCGRTRTMHVGRGITGMSPEFAKPPSFQNALVQSLAGGNTMVMNRAARNLLAEASIQIHFATHDWWAYLVITAAGGAVHYDPKPSVSYRQHPGNVLGENSSWGARLTRVYMLFHGQFSRWNAANVVNLEQNKAILTPDNAATLDAFAKARAGNVIDRFKNLMASGVYRQTLFGHLGLYFACLVRRL